MNTTQTQTATFYPRNVVSRSTQLAYAHKLAHRLGLETREGHDRGIYECYLELHIGKRSLKGASREERNITITALERDLAAQRPVYAVVSDEEALEILGVAA